MRSFNFVLQCKDFSICGAGADLPLLANHGLGITSSVEAIRYYGVEGLGHWRFG
jgi:hypothetical protein